MSAEGLTMKCKFTTAPFGEILPLGANAKFLDIQLDGLTGNYQQSGYPFDTPMWNGGVGVVRSAPPSRSRGFSPHHRNQPLYCPVLYPGAESAGCEHNPVLKRSGIKH